MTEKVPKNTNITLLQRILIKVRHGMVLQMIKNRIKKIGIDCTPYYLFEEGLDYREIPEINQLSAEYSFEFLDADDLKTVAKGTSGFTDDQWLTYFKSGGKCFGIKHKSEIATFMWINFNEIIFKSSTTPLKNNEAFVWYLYTTEAYRGKNLASYLRYRSYDILRTMGCDKLYSINETFNTPALRFKKKIKNAKKQKLILYIGLFNKIHREFVLRKY